MSEINKVILNAERMKEVGAAVGEVGKALGDAIRNTLKKH